MLLSAGQQRSIVVSRGTPAPLFLLISGLLFLSRFPSAALLLSYSTFSSHIRAYTKQPGPSVHLLPHLCIHAPNTTGPPVSPSTVHVCPARRLSAHRMLCMVIQGKTSWASLYSVRRYCVRCAFRLFRRGVRLSRCSRAWEAYLRRRAL